MTPLEQLEQDMRDAAERARDLVSEESPPKEEYTRGERQLILEQHREVLLRWADRLSAIRAAVGGDKPRCGEEHYELDAYIWRRESTQSWVLELSGCINDTTFITRHSEPLTTKPEDVASLPSLYAVGGEAQPVAWQVWRNGKVSASLTRPPMPGEVAYEEGETVRALYASPPATVDVGALRELQRYEITIPDGEVVPLPKGNWIRYDELAALIGKEA